jgi:predicted DsbA family dithiol-disulfide isomerase
MHIDTIFDTVCPWCFIGERRLQAALSQRPDMKVVRRWRPFLLNPDMPRDGMERQAYLYGKFGSDARIQRVYDAIADAGELEKIPFEFDRIVRTPNSVDSHRLIMFSEATGTAEQVVDALFQVYFSNGQDIGNRDVLLEIGERCGIDSEKLSRYFDSGADVDAVLAENGALHRLGINGVPAYIFNGTFVVSGAQESPILVRALDAASVADAAVS